MQRSRRHTEQPVGTKRALAAMQRANREFAVGLARAFGGAIIFSIPIFMTMEMWYLGFSMDRVRLILFLFLGIPLLVGLSHFAGFEATFGWKDDLLDAFVAYAVGFFTAALLLGLFAVLTPGMSGSEIVGKVAVQAVPGSIGALLARSQLGGREDEKQEKRFEAGYGGQLFLMAVGALFLAFSVAPTEEMELIAYQMTTWHTIALAFITIVLMHAFVYGVEFRGQVPMPPDTSFWSIFLRFTVAGYGVALLMSLYVLWTFGRLDGMAVVELTGVLIVLGFPAAIGAAAARLIL
jgi:putative integral membrane protein (TIGR02587 family)